MTPQPKQPSAADVEETEEVIDSPVTESTEFPVPASIREFWDEFIQREDVREILRRLA